MRVAACGAFDRGSFRTLSTALARAFASLSSYRRFRAAPRCFASSVRRNAAHSRATRAAVTASASKAACSFRFAAMLSRCASFAASTLASSSADLPPSFFAQPFRLGDHLGPSSPPASSPLLCASPRPPARAWPPSPPVVGPASTISREKSVVFLFLRLQEIGRRTRCRLHGLRPRRRRRRPGLDGWIMQVGALLRSSAIALDPEAAGRLGRRFSFLLLPCCRRRLFFVVFGAPPRPRFLLAELGRGGRRVLERRGARRRRGHGARLSRWSRRFRRRCRCGRLLCRSGRRRRRALAAALARRRRRAVREQARGALLAVAHAPVLARPRGGAASLLLPSWAARPWRRSAGAWRPSSPRGGAAFGLFSFSGVGLLSAGALAAGALAAGAGAALGLRRRLRVAAGGLLCLSWAEPALTTFTGALASGVTSRFMAGPLMAAARCPDNAFTMLNGL